MGGFRRRNLKKKKIFRFFFNNVAIFRSFAFKNYLSWFCDPVLSIDWLKEVMKGFPVSNMNFTEMHGLFVDPTKSLGLGCLCSNMPVFVFFDTWDKKKLTKKL